MIGENGVSASVGGESVTADVLVGADGSNGTVAKAAGLSAGIDRGIALEGNVAWSLLDEERFASTAVVEIGAPAGGYGWLFPKGDHANLGVGGWASEGPHLRDHLARLARAYDVDPDAITGLRGHQLPMRRIGASTPASSRVILVGDAAGLIDPLSGDGMYEAFVSARLAAEAIVAGDPGELLRGTCARARSSRGCLLDREARARSASGGVLLGRALTRRVRRRRRPAQGGCRAPGRGEGPRPTPAAADLARRAPRLDREALWGKGGAAGCRCSPDVIDLIDLLTRAVKSGASDVHLKLGQPPILRLDGDLEQMEGAPALMEADLEIVLDEVTQISPKRRDLFDESGDLDIAFSHPSLPRFRVNGFRQRGATSFAFRIIPNEIPNFEKLGLPPGVTRLAEERRGLVLVTGATGLRQDDVACLDARSHQPDTAPAHRHDRGSDRDPAP